MCVIHQHIQRRPVPPSPIVSIALLSSVDETISATYIYFSMKNYTDVFRSLSGTLLLSSGLRFYEICTGYLHEQGYARI